MSTRPQKLSRQSSPRRNISDGRKALYYAGMAVTGIGLLLFVSNFFVGASHMNDSASSFGDGPNMTGMVGRALGGMALMVVGQMMRSVGARGAAGSGLILDPERAREDIEPWARMGGGLLADAFDEADTPLGHVSPYPTPNEPDFADQLRKLKALFDEGVLTEAEYEREKAEVLENN